MRSVAQLRALDKLVGTVTLSGVDSQRSGEGHCEHQRAKEQRVMHPG